MSSLRFSCILFYVVLSLFFRVFVGEIKVRVLGSRVGFILFKDLMSCIVSNCRGSKLFIGLCEGRGDFC